MIIYSKPEIAPADSLSINLPELGRDYWVPTHAIVEADTIATSTSPAAKFRQVVLRDISSVVRTYELITENDRAEILADMMTSGQSAWYIANGEGLFEISLLAELVPLDPDHVQATLEMRVIRKVS